MENGYQNKLLKLSAILMIVFAVLGVITGAMASMQVSNFLNDDNGFTDMLIDAVVDDPSVMMQFGASDREELIIAMQDPEFQEVMGGIFAIVSGAIVVVALIAAIPRLIAGIMGLKRSRMPEKNQFFLVWGIVLLVLGVLGMSMSGTAPSANWIVSMAGGIVLPILYIVGANQAKKAYWAMRTAAGNFTGEFKPDAIQEPRNTGGPEF